MKYLPLLSALLLSASPVLADDFVYLECDYELKIESRAIRSNQLVMSEVEKISQYLKVDLKNNRLMTSDTEKWRDVLIVNGILYEEKYDEGDKYPIKGELSVVIQPPGMYSGEVFSRDDALRYVMRASGTCKEIDVSVFEEVLKESES